MMRTRLTLAGAALLALAVSVACNGSSYSSPVAPAPGPAPAPADLTITITGMNGGLSFSPDPASLKAGQTVAWRNADSISHTATADGGGFNTGVIAPGTTSAPIVMSAVGSFGYHCQIHPTMVGTLNVTQ